MEEKRLKSYIRKLKYLSLMATYYFDGRNKSLTMKVGESQLWPFIVLSLCWVQSARPDHLPGVPVTSL